MDLSQAILEALKEKPGQKAYELACRFGVKRTDVSALLYGELRGRVYQDSQYRWWLRETEVIAQPKQKAKTQNTLLAKLCQYYLDCLNHDDQFGVSVFTSSKHDDLDYVELTGMPVLAVNQNDIFDDDNVSRFWNKARRDKNLTIILGYPVLLKKAPLRNGEEGFVLEPVFLFYFNEDPLNRGSKPVLADELPQLNFKAIKSLLGGEANTIDELVSLSEELGLGNELSQETSPDFAEVIRRLRMLHNEWEWREEPNPYRVTVEPPLKDLKLPGIYNRAIILLAERSPYTRGLETELAKLQSVPEDVYRDTVLGLWLQGKQIESVDEEEMDLIETLPLNQEQRRAVIKGLTNPLTVITGPPGTGKSQVVTSLLINAAWKGQSVLFSSKNNRAVDVVEERVNGLGNYPILIRHGSMEYQNKMAHHLSVLLSSATNYDSWQEYENTAEMHKRAYQRLKALEDKIKQVIDLRNKVDHLEQRIELFRYEFSPSTFSDLRHLNLDEIENCFRTLLDKVTKADKNEQNLFKKMLWGLIKKSRFAQVKKAFEDAQPLLQKIELVPPFPNNGPSETVIREYKSFMEAFARRLDMVRTIKDYFQSLAELSTATPLERLELDLLKVQEEVQKISNILWQAWLDLLPKRLFSSPVDRNSLNQFNSLLGMLLNSPENDQRFAEQVRTQLMKLLSVLKKYLPCWAITSLSSHGRIPFEPGFFDLLIVDEASQCDIASVLPLLYRAKRVVVIGDPNQLRHISNLSPKQDTQLLTKHGLIDSHATWSYSRNSLFDRALGFCHSDNIVNLLEHHRSHADIIEFSNVHFYRGQLRIATHYKKLKRPSKEGPAIQWVDVRGTVIRPQAGSIYNKKEAQVIIKEIERLVLQGYEGTIGVVSPFRPQALYIRELLHKNYPELEQVLFSRFDFEVDTVHKFQGDERDLILFSPVVSWGCPEGPLRFLRRTGNLFNVAVTRARAALVVVGNEQYVLQCGVNYLEEFAKYVASLKTKAEQEPLDLAALGPVYPKVANPEQVSEWEKILYQALYKAGIRTIPQYPVEKYRLDLALISDDGRRLDIEVDGERYHRDWTGDLCQRDRLRNCRLQEYGWDVLRFWVYEVRDDLEGCVRRVKDWLEQGAFSGV
ncbi:MAG TPA: AAA domain-containing protein [Aequorivita sp.]|nr:AAA domain-containing protein [Aequorivita sp.]